MQGSGTFAVLGPSGKPVWWQWSKPHRQSQELSVRGRRDPTVWGLVPLPSRHCEGSGLILTWQEKTQFQHWLPHCFDSYHFLGVEQQRVEQTPGAKHRTLHTFFCHPCTDVNSHSIMQIWVYVLLKQALELLLTGKECQGGFKQRF